MNRTITLFSVAMLWALTGSACTPEQNKYSDSISDVSIDGTSQPDRSDRKIKEITKIVTLTDAQEKIIRRAVDEYNGAIDSSIYAVSDACDAARVKYLAGKKFNHALMSSLTEVQRNKYIRVISTPEVETKTDYKLSLLKESGQYTDADVENMKTKIFNYLMAEKIVYARDKYDIKKQKENIARLKNILPAALKASNAFEKIKGQGKSIKGGINW